MNDESRLYFPGTKDSVESFNSAKKFLFGIPTFLACQYLKYVLLFTYHFESSYNALQSIQLVFLPTLASGHLG